MPKLKLKKSSNIYGSCCAQKTDKKPMYSKKKSILKMAKISGDTKAIMPKTGHLAKAIVLKKIVSLG